MSSVQQFGMAWLALAASLALHVLDEARSDFLNSYNAAIRAVRRRYAFLPLPALTFGRWLTGLAVAVAVLFALSPVAFQGNRWVLYASYPLALIMFVTGLGHLAASLYLRRRIPGVNSSPLLVAASILLFLSAWSLN